MLEYVKVNWCSTGCPFHPSFQGAVAYRVLGWSRSGPYRIRNSWTSKAAENPARSRKPRSRWLLRWNWKVIQRVGSWRCDCHVTWFCYQLIAKPGNKTVASPWPDPWHMYCSRMASGTSCAEQNFGNPRTNSCIFIIELLQLVCRWNREKKN